MRMEMLFPIKQVPRNFRETPNIKIVTTDGAILQIIPLLKLKEGLLVGKAIRVEIVIGATVTVSKNMPKQNIR